jgi:hypothetical protein
VRTLNVKQLHGKERARNTAHCSADCIPLPKTNNKMAAILYLGAKVQYLDVMLLFLTEFHFMFVVLHAML